MMNRRPALALALACLLPIAALAAQEPKKETVEGVRNFTNVSPTIACAGATEARVMPELAKRGYKAVINLRQASEQGADIEGTRAAAEAAGIRFIHLPLNPQQPDPAVVDNFLKAAADAANQPTFINCGSASRVSALMITKRMLTDGWTQERALAEAAVIGPPAPALQEFALKYVAERKK
jgi:uncharacterized protein (TIGR01244 family)